jgi:TetR/AcrR family transcriptional regulator
MVVRRSSGTSLREERRRRQEELSQNHILDAAELVFGQKGFAGATVKEIAEAAEFSVGAVYNFFDSKTQLFAAVMSRRNEECLDLLKQAVTNDRPAVERLHAMVEAILDYYFSHEEFYRLFQRAIGGAWLNIKASFNEENYRQYRDVLAVETELFADGVASGEFRKEDPATMAVIFAGMLQAYLAHCIIDIKPGGRSATRLYPPKQLIALVDRAFLRPNP